MRLILSVAAVLATTLAPVALASPGGWACMKGGSEVAVKGKSAKDKKKLCASQGGVWEKKSAKGDKGADAAKGEGDGGGGGTTTGGGGSSGGSGGGW